MLEAGGALLLTSLLALVLGVSGWPRGGGGGPADGAGAPAARKLGGLAAGGARAGGAGAAVAAGGERRRGRRLAFLRLFLAAPLGDADHQQEQQDRRDQAGDEVLDVVADEVAGMLGKDGLAWAGASSGHGERQGQDQGRTGTHRTRSYLILPLNSRSTSRRTSRSAIWRRRSALLAPGQRQLDLRPRALEVDPRRDQGQSFLRGLADQPLDLAPVQEQFARPLRLVVLAAAGS